MAVEGRYINTRIQYNTIKYFNVHVYFVNSFNFTDENIVHLEVSI